jgi:hypothetical protein
MEARFPRLPKGGWVAISEEAILPGGSAEVGIHGGAGGSVSENDNIAGEPDGESGGDGGVGWLERVFPLCPYVPTPLIDNVFAKLRLGVAPIPSCAIIDTFSQMYRHLSTGLFLQKTCSHCCMHRTDFKKSGRGSCFQGNLEGARTMALIER